MKTHLLFISIISLALSANMSMAQGFDRISVEKKYNGETYLVDSIVQSTFRTSTNGNNIMRTIINKNNEALSGSAIGNCYNLKEKIPLEEVFKHAISKEKIKSLSCEDKNKMIITFFYNTETGQVAHIWFSLRGVSLSEDVDSETCITLKDINRLEKLFIEYHFDVSQTSCEEIKGKKVKYGKWMHVFGFSKLAKEEEK